MDWLKRKFSKKEKHDGDEAAQPAASSSTQKGIDGKTGVDDVATDPKNVAAGAENADTGVKKRRNWFAMGTTEFKEVQDKMQASENKFFGNSKMTWLKDKYQGLRKPRQPDLQTLAEPVDDWYEKEKTETFFQRMGRYVSKVREMHSNRTLLTELLLDMFHLAVNLGDVWVTGMIPFLNFWFGVYMVGADEMVEGCAVIFSIYLLVVVFIFVCPGTLTEGYACNVDSAVPLKYVLTGFPCWVFTIMVWSVASYYNESVFTYFGEKFWANFFAANFIGHAMSFFAHCRGILRKYAAIAAAPAGTRCHTKDMVPVPQAQNPFESYFVGWAWNPQWDRFDTKIFLYLAGAIQSQLNLLGMWAVSDHGVAPTTVLLLQSWFIGEYLFQEHVHIYTYDFFCERTGMKLIWGCFFFWAFVYPISMWPFAGQYIIEQIRSPLELNYFATSCIVMLFFFGWTLTRGANLQKYYIKTDPKRQFVFGGLIEQKTLEGSNGRLLISGFWGTAQHINYLGEIIQALAISLPGLIVCEPYGRIVAAIYPIYYVLLMVPRCISDNSVCKKKYGKELWHKYTALVPAKMVPGIF